MKRRFVWSAPVFVGFVVGVLYWLGIVSVWSDGWLRESEYVDTASEIHRTETANNGSAAVIEPVENSSIVTGHDGSTPLKETIHPVEPVDYTDPFDVTRNLFYGTLQNLFECKHLTSRTLDSRSPPLGPRRRRIRNPFHMLIPRQTSLSRLLHGSLPRSDPPGYPSHQLHRRQLDILVSRRAGHPVREMDNPRRGDV